MHLKQKHNLLQILALDIKFSSHYITNIVILLGHFFTYTNRIFCHCHRIKAENKKKFTTILSVYNKSLIAFLTQIDYPRDTVHDPQSNIYPFFRRVKENRRTIVVVEVLQLGTLRNMMCTNDQNREPHSFFMTTEKETNHSRSNKFLMLDFRIYLVEQS